LALPDSLAWLQAVVMEKLPGRPLLSRDNLASASLPNVASGPMDPILGLDHLTSLHTVAPVFLGEAQAKRILSRRSRHDAPVAPRR
jgi:NADH dehydrogenase